MSAYICSDETISVIANAFVNHGVDFNAENYSPDPLSIMIGDHKRQSIGQCLLNKNYDSVNYRYDEESKPHLFEYKFVNDCMMNGSEDDLGLVLGCIKNYIYQACEEPNFFETELYKSLCNLKDEIGECAVKKLGYDIQWGYPHDYEKKGDSQ